MTLESSKILGGVGAILMFVGILPFINYFGICELVGLILVLAGLYGLGGFYNERGIFNNALYGVIAGIVGVVISVVVAVAVVLTSLTDFIYQIFPGWNGDWASLSGLTPDTSSLTNLTGIWSFIAGILVVFVVLWIFAIVAAFLIRRGLRQASDKTSVGLFSTAGLLLLGRCSANRSPDRIHTDMDSCTVTRHRILHGKTCTTTNGNDSASTTDTSLNAFKQLHFFCLYLQRAMIVCRFKHLPTLGDHVLQNKKFLDKFFFPLQFTGLLCKNRALGCERGAFRECTRCLRCFCC